MVYYENNIPFVFNGRLSNHKATLEWLIHQRNTASIEEVTDAMLPEILEENEFVAVLFTGHCLEDEDDGVAAYCRDAVRNLEQIDSTLDEHGIVMVMTGDTEVARERYARIALEYDSY